MSDDSQKNDAEEKSESPKFEADENWRQEVQADDQKSHAVPAPDVMSFLAGLFTQTLMALGLVENPLTGQKEANLDEAQYLIDVIAMLQNKMKGNLTADEEGYFRNVLYQLRMQFVEAKSARKAGS